MNLDFFKKSDVNTYLLIKKEVDIYLSTIKYYYNNKVTLPDIRDK